MHWAKQLWIVLLIAALVLAAACSDDASETDPLDGDGDGPIDGDEPDGDEPDGDDPDGDDPDGDEPDGDQPDGDDPDGDEPDGDEPDGDDPDGDSDGDDDGDDPIGDPCDTDGEKRCDETILQQCVDGIWEDELDCETAGLSPMECRTDDDGTDCYSPLVPETLIDRVSDGEIEADGETWWVDARAGGREAAASNPWIYVRFSDGSRAGATLEKVAISDVAAKTDTTWHLAFKRHSIKMNSGVDFGGGEVGVKKLKGPLFEQVTHYLPIAAYEKDDYLDENGSVIPDAIGGPATVLSDWYSYDMNTHGLTPMARVYVFQAGTAYVKFELLSYYRTINDPDAGDVSVSSWYQVRFAFLTEEIAATSGSTLTDASCGGSGHGGGGSATNPPSYVSFATGQTDIWSDHEGNPDYTPADDASWDIYLKRTDVGITWAQAGGLVNMGVVDFASVTEVPSEQPYLADPNLIASFAGYTPVLDAGNVYLVKTDTASSTQAIKLTVDSSTFDAENYLWTRITVRHAPLPLMTSMSKRQQLARMELLGVDSVTAATEVDGDADGDTDGDADEEGPQTGVTFTADLPNEDSAVYYSLTTEAEVTVSDEATDTSWHLKFTQGGIMLNSGADFPGSVVGAALGQVDFDALEDSGELHWLTEAPNLPALLGWYSMSGMTLSSRGYVYLIRTAQGWPIKLEITGYYHPDTDTSGWYSYDWAYLP